MKLSFGYYAFALAVLIIAAVWFKETSSRTNADLDERLNGPQPTLTR